MKIYTPETVARYSRQRGYDITISARGQIYFSNQFEAKVFGLSPDTPVNGEEIIFGYDEAEKQWYAIASENGFPLRPKNKGSGSVFSNVRLAKTLIDSILPPSKKPHRELVVSIRCNLAPTPVQGKQGEMWAVITTPESIAINIRDKS